MNEINTTTSCWEEIDKQSLSRRIIKNSAQLLEDYVLWRKRGWSDEEFGELLGVSAKTVRNRYLADARKQGLIEAHHNSRTEQNVERARNRARSSNTLEPPKDISPTGDIRSSVVTELPVENRIQLLNQYTGNSKLSTKAAALMDEEGHINPSNSSPEELAEISTGALATAEWTLGMLKMTELDNDSLMRKLGTINSDGSFTEWTPYELVLKTLDKLSNDELHRIKEEIGTRTDYINVSPL